MQGSVTLPNLYIIDDDEVCLNFFSSIFCASKTNVHSFNSARDFISAYRESPFECVLTDVRMPGMSGIELQKKLAKEHPSLPVIIVTGFADIPSAVAAVRNGAYDFIEKPCSHLLLKKRILNAFAVSALNKLINKKIRQIDDVVDKLTPRENEVLRSALNGEKNKIIAHKLGISEKTVEVHRYNIKNKFYARSFVELASHLSFYRGTKMDGVELLLRLNLENDVLSALGECNPIDGSVRCFDHIQEISKSMSGSGEKSGIFEKVKVIIELEKFADTCQWAAGNSCRTRLILSDIMA